MDNLIDLEDIKRLKKDLVTASVTLLSRREVRFLVDTYYNMQDDRKRAASQILALDKAGEPNQVIQWLFDKSKVLEKSVQAALDAYSAHDPLGQWARSIVGIGPVISAGLLAHIDLEKAPTVGHIWRYAGLDPTVTWEKGQKMPWNDQLKTLCWKIGESFVKTCNHEDSYYGPIYQQRKEYETARNDRMENVIKAEEILTKKKIGKDTEAYKHLSTGKLPPGQLHSRAKRYAVKLFLAHYHEMGFKLILKKEPPLPYPIAHLGHVHKIEPPSA